MVAGLAYAIRRAQLEVVRMRTYGRLSQLRIALANYEHANGTLPPRQLTGENGVVQFSWRIPILPHMEQADLHKALDRSKDWNDPHNLEVPGSNPLFLDFITMDGYFACPLNAEESIWNPHTGLPVGKLSESPDSVALIAIPMNSIQPFQPLSVTIDQLRDIAANGEESFFIRSDGKCGSVKYLNGEITIGPP